LDFSRTISSSRSSRSRSFKAVAAPASARSRHSVNLATETFHLSGHQIQRLAAQQSRDDRHLALNGKALRTFPVDARRGAFASFGGALRHPFGLEPIIIATAC
jgi:hypothetical protein